jgi:hypothetical protein
VLISRLCAEPQRPSSDSKVAAGEWIICIEHQGHEPKHCRTELSSNGGLRIYQQSGTGNPWKEILSKRVAAQEDLTSAFAAATTLVRNFRMTDQARSDIGRDEDDAICVTLKTSNRSLVVQFQMAEQRRDQLLTEDLATLYSAVNRCLPKTNQFELPTALQSAK